MTDEQYIDDPMNRIKAIVERHATGYDTVCTHRIDGVNIRISEWRKMSKRIIHVGIPTYFDMMPNEVIDDLVDNAFKRRKQIREGLEDYTKEWFKRNNPLDTLVAEKKLIHFRDKIYVWPDADTPATTNSFLGIVMIHPKMLDESVVSPEEFQWIIHRCMDSLERYALNLPSPLPTSSKTVDILDRVWKSVREERKAQMA